MGESEMKAVILRETGDAGNLWLEEVPTPTPRAGEIVVRLRAAALNHRDVWIRRGQYAGIRLPIILGSDGAGEVVEIGEGCDSSMLGKPVLIYPALNWGPDPRVFGHEFRILGMPDAGTYAERIRVPAANVFPIPPGYSYEEGAAFPLAALTAFRAVVTRAQLAKGEIMLITGIGGGVSLFALQIAKALGASVYVTSGSEVKRARALQMGAAGGANYHDTDWGDQILQMTGGSGPDVALDSVGGSTFDQVIDLVKPGGRIVTYGATTGPAPQIQVRRIFWKQLNILGSTMGTPQEFELVLQLFTEKNLRPVIDEVFPLAEVSAAHLKMEKAEQFGKIVLHID
jgi:NADPH:quinone reductase-like Zn-dependent oxidoreductase